MAEQCVCCGGDHSSFKCPLFGPAKDFIATAMRGALPASLARKQPSLFEELYGGELGLLQDVIDDTENYDADERNLALKILAGHHLKGLSRDDQLRLDRIALGLAGAPRGARHAPAQRPARVQVREDDEEGPTGRPGAALDRAFPNLMDNDEYPDTVG